ncbi:hemolysin family protein [Synoicihabitans lomoniglobus]|uniref:Hemolysin family protein n=1 Tax=Synoicihabitans lomoniglobus TaxID=2909285 RepID=A0AAF0CNU3_9BACT|nr:hemolysin family protein [Opitutaceae bacterium LMO-M01]WED64850.1 hemolysin family protein [Opitutaceae bacterium LMO-M01]
MNSISNELLVLLLLLLTNGILAMAEAALIAARKSRLRELAEGGDKRAALALAEASEPARFLSTVQVGITLVAVIAGAFGGGSFADHIGELLANISWLEPYSRPLSLGIVVVGITLASVVLGELVPKRIALLKPELFAMFLVRPVRNLSRIVAPAVHLLTWLTELVLRPFGLHNAPQEAPVTEEEVNTLVEQGMTEGVFNESERDMVAGVLELDEMPIAYLMTPRPKLVFLDIAEPDETNWRKVVASGHSHFPVVHGNREQVIGMVSVKAIWANNAFGVPTQLRHLVTPPLVVPETMVSSQVLEQFKLTGKHIALVNDEFGSVAGVVTLYDVLEAIVGDIPESGRHDEPEAKQRTDGSWLIDATYDIDEFKELTGLATLPHEDETEFQTVGGFVMTHFGRIPGTGESFEHDGWRFEVVDMDRHRLDKLLVAQVPKAETDEEEDDGEEQVAG